MLAEGAQAPLEAEVILLRVLILHEVLILLIDRVIRQVHVLVILIYLGGVGLRGEPSQAFLEDIYPQRLIAGNQNVDAEIELMPIYEEWIRHVSRND